MDLVVWIKRYLIRFEFWMTHSAMSYGFNGSLIQYAVFMSRLPYLRFCLKKSEEYYFWHRKKTEKINLTAIS